MLKYNLSSPFQDAFRDAWHATSVYCVIFSFDYVQEFV